MGINIFITFPIYILFNVLSSVGDIVLFMVSAYTMVQFVKDRVKIFKDKYRLWACRERKLAESRHLNIDILDVESISDLTSNTSSL